MLIPGANTAAKLENMAESPEAIRHTLSQIFHAQGETLIAEILDLATVMISNAGYDFGHDIYSFDLRLPPAKFAAIEQHIDAFEKKLRAKLLKIGLDGDHEYLTVVRIVPALVLNPGSLSTSMPTQTDVKRIWKPGRIRLFLSHVSRIKIQTSALKEALSAFGIDAFVAHEDIQPNQVWLKEIEFALHSADALCALVTEDFIKSQFTDQEVGFALGRGIPVIPVRCGTDPYGLFGKHQAISADLAKLQEAAPKIAEVIAQQDHLKVRFTEATVDSIVLAYSFKNAKNAMKQLQSTRAALSDAQILRLLEAVRDNSQVRDAHGVPPQIRSIAAARNIVLADKVTARGDDFDDDIPF
jgi:hypothetical protein